MYNIENLSLESVNKFLLHILFFRKHKYTPSQSIPSNVPIYVELQNISSSFNVKLKNKDLPVYLQKEAMDWSKDFKSWAKEKQESMEKLSEAQLLLRAKKILRSDDLSLISDNGRSFHIRRLRASTFLHKILENVI